MFRVCWLLSGLAGSLAQVGWLDRRSHGKGGAFVRLSVLVIFRLTARTCMPVELLSCRPAPPHLSRPM